MKNIVTIAFVLAFAAQSAFAQVNTNNVGIGTSTPHPAAILDAANPYNPLTTPITRPKGILMPTLNQLQRDAMVSFYNDTLPDGLLIYEADSGYFWYYRHLNPTPPVAPFGNWIKLEVAGGSNNNNIPVGGIIMWNGVFPPTGWALCDGTFGTPDLTDKFVISIANSADSPGNVANEFVTVGAGAVLPPNRRFYKLAYIMKL